MKHEYYVTKSGVPCRLVTEGINRRGVLVACKPDEELTIFGVGYRGSVEKAKRAIGRTLKEVKKYHDSILSDWPKLKRLLEPGFFTIAKRPCSTTSN